MKRKLIERQVSIADAVSEAFGEFQSLGEEMRSWADSMEEKFSSTDKYSRVSETADILESCNEPDHPQHAQDTVITVIDPPAKKRGYSRADRCSQACMLLDYAMEALETKIEALGENDTTAKDELESYRDEIDEAKSNAEGADFPGMYG